MIKEFSAGGIVFKKKSKDQRLKTKDLFWLVCQHSQHKGWVFPKGLIGDHTPGESSEITAVREVEEETGIKARIIKKLKKPVTYFYTWKGEKRFKTVYYFLMEYIDGDITKHDHEMSAVEWVREKDVLVKLSYKSDKLAFGEVLEIFSV